jgi:Tfp pilus assembly protein PilO
VANKVQASKNAPKPKPTKKELSANNYVAIVVAIVLVIVLISGFVANSLIRDIILNTKVIAAKQKAISDLNTKLDDAPKLIEAYNQLGSRKDLIKHSLPNTADFPQLVSIIESMGGTAGVTVKSVEPSAGVTAQTTGPANNSSAKPYVFSTTLEGPYPKILALLKNIEISSRPMKVSSVQFTGNSGNVAAEIVITTYYQDPADIKDKTEVIK